MRVAIHFAVLMEFPTGAGKDTVFVGLSERGSRQNSDDRDISRSDKEPELSDVQFCVFYCDSLVESAFSSVSSSSWEYFILRLPASQG